MTERENPYAGEAETTGQTQDTAAPAKRSLGCFRVVVLVFAVFWWGMLVLFLRGLPAQVASGYRHAFVYQQTEARVTQITERAGSQPSLAKYTFTVGGQPYTGQFDRGQKGAANVSIGDALPVWYDPADPSQFTLKPEKPVFPLGILMFLTPFILAGIGMVVLGLFAPQLMAWGLRQKEKIEACEAIHGAGSVGVPWWIYLGGWLLLCSTVMPFAAFVVFGLDMFVQWPQDWRIGLWIAAGTPALCLLLTPFWTRRRLRRKARRLAGQEEAA